MIHNTMRLKIKKYLTRLISNEDVGVLLCVTDYDRAYQKGNRTDAQY